MSEPRVPRIGLGIPTRDLCASQFTTCLADMYAQFCSRYVSTGQAEATLICDMGTLLPDMRNTIAKQALDLDCTHLLWLDNDMTFPPDALERLLAHDLPIVGASYTKRKEPCTPIAAKNGVWVYTDDAATGVEEVDFVGMGCMLVNTDVFRALDMPWHCLAWNDAKQDMVGEDVYFCRKARKAGFPTFIDHDLTKEIGHIGSRVFTYRDAVAARPMLAAEQKAKAAEASKQVETA